MTICPLCIWSHAKLQGCGQGCQHSMHPVHTLQSSGRMQPAASLDWNIKDNQLFRARLARGAHTDVLTLYDHGVAAEASTPGQGLDNQVWADVLTLDELGAAAEADVQVHLQPGSTGSHGAVLAAPHPRLRRHTTTDSSVGAASHDDFHMPLSHATGSAACPAAATILQTLLHRDRMVIWQQAGDCPG